MNRKKHLWPLILGLVGVFAIATAFGTEDEPLEEPEDDGVVLGEEDLAERGEILRNQFRRMTPGDEPLVQDIGTWPAAWEEFGTNWDSAAADREYGAWVVPVELTQENGATVMKDGEGNELWRGTTDFARPESADVVLTGGLVAEEDWAVYEAVRGAVEEMTADASRVDIPVPMRSHPTNGLRFTSCAWATNDSFHMDLAYEVDTNVDLFVYAVAHTSALVVATWTNDENVAITDTNTVWYSVGEPFNGRDSTWEYLDTVAIDNGVAEYEDSGFPAGLGRLRYYAAAVANDSDGDGLSDGQEAFISHTDPGDDDTDGDGLEDGDEINVYGTDPTKADTDGDGLNDGVEINLGLNPTDPDMDDDGLNDGYEQSIGTDPEDPDSDHDGLPDGWEVQNGLSPTIATGSNGADGDPDNDGFPNSLEFLLSGAAMNPAWSGEQLTYRLCHLQNGENQPGLHVTIADALNCGGSNDSRQNVAACLDVPGLMACGYYIDLAVEGSVEDQNANFDKVSFEAVTNTPFFEGNENHNGCAMVTKCVTNRVLVFPNSQVRLRYDTVGHMFHTNAYARVAGATLAASYDMEVEGADFLCIGNTAPMTVPVADGGPFSWSVTDEAATISADGILTAVTTGVAVVTASNSEGCSVSKEVKVVQLLGVEAYSPSLPDNGSFGVNPEFFEGGQTYFGEPDRNPPYWWLPGTYANPSSRVFKVFYKFTQNPAVPGDPFAIFLYANLSEYGLPENGTAFEWSLLEGPENSGHFAETNGLVVRFLEPVKGGLYRFRLKVGVPGGTPLLSDAWVLLPKAGGEIGGWLTNEVAVAIQQAQAWTNAIANVALDYGENQDSFLFNSWIKIANDNFDYQGIAGNPTRRYSFTDADRPANHQPDSSIPGMAGAKGNGDWDEPSYATLKGVVIHRAKITDLMYAIWGRTLGYSETLLSSGASANAIFREMWGDNDSSQNAIGLGFDLYDAHIQNGNLDALLTFSRSLGLQTPDDSSGLNDVNLWPDSEPVAYPHLFWLPAMPTNYSYLIQPIQPR